jgi:hypothetical protein
VGKILRRSMMSFAFVVSSFALITCEKSPTGPEPVKDPRTLTFTVDTLHYPDYAFQTTMYDIAGTAANNVFTVGHNSSDGAGTMFRFDGKSWKTTGFYRTEGGPISGSMDLTSLLVLSPDNIWFVGARFPQNPNPPPITIDSSFILHYDGRGWQEYKAYGGRELLSIHGIAPNDIWACGFSGTLLHYNGVQWERDSIPMSVPQGGEYVLRDIAAISSQTVFIIGYIIDHIAASTTFYFFKRAGGRWTAIDSSVWRSDADLRWGTVDLWISPSGTLYSVGGVGVYRWNGIQWIRMIDSPQPLQRIWGSSDDSFFVGGYRTLLHFNGRDFYQYPSLMDDVVCWGIWGNSNELFVVANDGRKSFVYHGR